MKNLRAKSQTVAEQDEFSWAQNKKGIKRNVF
jgi:hypothetical protein